MGNGPRLLTERLVMRRWRDSDLEPFAALNADPEVMEHFPATLTRADSDAFVARIEARFDRDSYGLWALEVAETGRFIGYTGLALQTFEAHFTPAVEVGWRLARPAWGHGYATEAARAAVAFGFERARLDEIVSFTATTNLRSQAVMQRLGMTHDPADDFDHPALPGGHPLRRHVLYRVPRRPSGSPRLTAVDEQLDLLGHDLEDAGPAPLRSLGPVGAGHPFQQAPRVIRLDVPGDPLYRRDPASATCTATGWARRGCTATRRPSRSRRGRTPSSWRRA